MLGPSFMAGGGIRVSEMNVGDDLSEAHKRKASDEETTFMRKGRAWFFRVRCGFRLGRRIRIIC